MNVNATTLRGQEGGGGIAAEGRLHVWKIFVNNKDAQMLVQYFENVNVNLCSRVGLSRTTCGWGRVEGEGGNHPITLIPNGPGPIS